MSIASLARALRTARDQDRGVALPTVLIFMLVGVILTMVVASTVLYSYSFTSSTRAGVQAQASAQAGIAAARAGLLNGTCADSDGAYTSTAPFYEVQIYKPNGTGGWTPGCPAISQDARIVATGKAATKGVNDSSRDSADIETILGSSGSAPTIAASGPAIFAYGASGAGAGGKIVSLDGSNVDIMLRTGTVTCDGGFQGAANVVVKSGTFNAVAGCNLAGNVWVNGDVNISGGAKIGGSVTGTNVTISNGTVNGNMWVDQVFTGTNGTIGGWVSADVLKIGGSTVGSAWSRSTTTAASMTGGRVNGVLTVSNSIAITGGTLVSTVVAAGSVTTSISAPAGVVAGGDVTVNNGTTTGVQARGTLIVNSGNVAGTVTAGGFRMGSGWLTFTGGKFAGAACINTNGDVSGPVTAASYTSGGGCNAKGDPSWWWNGHGPFTTGTVATPPAPVLAASPPKPAAITVPNWVDFGSKGEHFAEGGWPGYVVVALSPTNCTANTFYTALQTIGTSPGVVDARNCTNGIEFTSSGTEYTGPFGWGDDLSRNGFTFKNDLVIIANKFALSGSARFTGAGTESQLWLINPDTIANGTPDCAPGEQLKIDGGFTFQKLRTMVYSPCKIVIGSSTSLKGQIFAGETQIAGGATITYAPLGLPGYDLGTGDPTAVTATEWDRPVLSQRNITG